jgi:hypothetical protein
VLALVAIASHAQRRQLTEIEPDAAIVLSHSQNPVGRGGPE